MVLRKQAVKYLPLRVKFLPTNDILSVRFIQLDTTIKDLRANIEIAAGIPFDIQILHYLDEADLPDESTVRRSDMVPNAILSLNVHHTWRDLVEAVINNDAEWVMKLGVTKDTDFHSPTLDYLLGKDRAKWIQRRADYALLLAAHRGHTTLCQKLIAWGANVDASTPLGRTPLHLASTQDHGDVIDLLLSKGADINRTDSSGFNALALANQFGHKGCERHLFMFRWQQRAKSSQPQFLNPPLMAFQTCDSLYPKWKCGPAAQVYFQKLLPPGEFIGSAFNAPRRSWHRRGSAPDLTREESQFVSAGTDEAGDSGGSGGTSPVHRKGAPSFEEWQRRKLKQNRIEEQTSKQKQQIAKDAEDDKIRQRYKRMAGKLPEGASSRWTAANRPLTIQGGADTGQLSGDGSGGAAAALSDMRARIEAVMTRHGPDLEMTTFDEWWRRRGGQEQVKNPWFTGLLPYQVMIREFCTRKCH